MVLVQAEWERIELGQKPATEPARRSGPLTVLLAQRAFASGCTALTGVVAIDNGNPTLRPFEARNAATTLTVMGLLAILMFTGLA